LELERVFFLTLNSAKYSFSQYQSMRKLRFFTQHCHCRVLFCGSTFLEMNGYGWLQRSFWRLFVVAIKFDGQGEERIQIARSTVKSIFWTTIFWVLDRILSFCKLLDVLPDLFKWSVIDKIFGICTTDFKNLPMDLSQVYLETSEQHFSCLQ
jgi:hypothetical protein